MLYFLKTLKQFQFSILRITDLFYTHVMTRQNVRIQGWVFPLFFSRLRWIFTGSLFYIEVVIHEVLALDNTVYRKCPMALKCQSLSWVVLWCEHVHVQAHIYLPVTFCNFRLCFPISLKFFLQCWSLCPRDFKTNVLEGREFEKQHNKIFLKP